MTAHPDVLPKTFALLARHLEAVQDTGRDHIWLRPGIELKPGAGRAERLAALEEETRMAPAPKALGTLRDTFVFASGNPEAILVFVGEAPGSDEERQGEPFVGKAGQLLDKIIGAMGLDRSEIYITNIVKYRPKIGDGEQGSANRKPSQEEMESCLPFLRRELAIIRPKVLVALGASAYSGLTGDYENGVGRMRSRFHDFNGIPLMVTYHPSYLLRNTAKSERRKVWEDLLQVMEKLEMPISERQRDFFT